MAIVGLLSAVIDAIMGEDNRVAGSAVTRLTTTLTDTHVTAMVVGSTNGFGGPFDTGINARLLVGGEVIYATSRTSYSFKTLSRGQEGTQAKQHPPGTLVYDLSDERSAKDRLRRGTTVRWAEGADLDVVGANLGMHRCPGLDDTTYRKVIQAVAYLAKQPKHAFEEALTALVGSGNYLVYTNLPHQPWRVFCEVLVTLATTLKGRFVLNGGFLATSLSTTRVDLPVGWVINHVVGVFVRDTLTDRGYRGGTNYFGAGSFVNNEITLGTALPSSPLAVVVDAGVWKAHYLADNEAIRDSGDYYAYLADSLAGARCLLDNVRAAGVKVDVIART